MKRFLLLALTFLLVLNMPAYAEENTDTSQTEVTTQAVTQASIPTAGKDLSDSITVSFEDTLRNFYVCELAKIRLTIHNTAQPMGASIRFTLDGNEVSGVGSDYFVIGSENKENFDLFIPASLQLASDHKIGVVLKLEDDSVYTNDFAFYLPQNGPKISFSYISQPACVTIGHELYYGLKFSVSEPSRRFLIPGRMTITGYDRAELDNQLVIYDGALCYLYVPADYTNCDFLYFDFAYTVNPQHYAGADSYTGKSSVKMQSQSYARYLEVSNKIHPLIIPATTKTATNAYYYSSLSGYATTFPAGTTLTYLNPDAHDVMHAAKIQSDAGYVYWVPMSNITISTQNYTIPDNLSFEEKEIFVNGKGYDSKTDYLIWVNKERQILNVFLGKQGQWKIVKTMPVATGKNYTPTPTCECEYQYRTVWNNPGYVCNPVLSLFDGYAIHNQPKSHSGYVIDSTIGSPASAGCIRMLQEDVNWVSLYVPIHTKVVIY